MLELSPMDKLWPVVPDELKYIEFRVPGTFRELMANRNLTNDEIGRIVRCLALDTDFFMTPRIEAEVFYYRKYLIKKSETRKRVEALRNRRKQAEAGMLCESLKREGDGVTVTNGAKTDEKPLPNPKTPSDLKEKTPPIVPLEKKAPVSLEKKATYRHRPRKNKTEEYLSGDLFSLVAGRERQEENVEVEVVDPENPKETHTGGPVARSSGLDDTEVPQDIETPHTGVFERSDVKSVDTRNDLAWIPEKFAMFWKEYPRKVAKGDAVKAFTKLIKIQHDVDKFMATLMASLSWWKGQSSWTKDKGKFIPYPATWLNSGHWEDSKENSVVSGTTGDAKYLSMDNESTEDLLRRMRGG